MTENVQLIRQSRNKLKEKALIDGGEGGFDEAALDKLDEIFAEAASNYPDVAKEYLAKLDAAVQAYESTVESGGNLRSAIGDVHKIAHELKGQGSTFGYKLITAFGNSLYKFTKPDVPIGEQHAKILKAHADSIKIVIIQDIKGDGGAIGKELAISLHKACEKYS